MAMVRAFPAVAKGIRYVFKLLNCSGKERFRHLLSIPGELLLTADQSRKSVLHKLVLIMDRTFGHALSVIKNLREIRAKAAFFWLKRGFFQIYSSVLKV